MKDIFLVISEVGFPIAITIVSGFFIFLTIKYLLDSVIGQINGLYNIIEALDNRVKTMNHDIIRIDATMCSVLGIRPDLERISRADGKEDARRD